MPYAKMNSDDIACIKLMADSERVFVGGEISEDYSHDELGGITSYPDVLVKVKTEKEISDIISFANKRNIPVVVRGSGTGLVGAAVAVEGGIMLETTMMNRILELDEENLVVTVEPGVLLMELAEFVEAHGFLYPPDPGEKSATIGGNISTNAGGMRAVKYGVTRDYVRGLTVVLPTGEIVELGGKVVKNSSGYDLKGAVIGSEGTLGIITKAVLKLLPLPEVSVSLLVPFATMQEALDIVPDIIKSKTIPTAIEYFCRETILLSEDYLGKKFPDSKSDAYILLTFDGNDSASVEREYTEVADMCLRKGALDVYIIDTDERKKSVWSARGAFLEAIKASTSEMDECDVVVPRNRIAEFIRYTHRISKDLDIRIPSFGHAGDGNLHIYVCRDKLDGRSWDEALNRAFDLMYDKAREMGGMVSGEHGIGFAKKSYMHKQYGETQIRLMRGIKASFDPNNILNPHKVCQ